MSKPKQWKQGRELKHADAWNNAVKIQESPALRDDEWYIFSAYPQEAEQPDRLLVGSGDAS
jgi:hypothetical protein